MITNRIIIIVLGVASFAGSVAAQFPDPDALKADFERSREEQLKSAAREDRLHEMFYRHAMGLPVEIAQLFSLTKAEAELPRARAEENLNSVRQDVQKLIKEYEALKLRVKTLQKKAPVPTVQLPSRAPVLPKHPEDTGSRVQTTGKPKARPRVSPRFVPYVGVGSGGRKPHGKPPTTRPTKPAMLIKGSGDHSLVGRILFRAGKYESAIKELLVVVDSGKADFSDLFHLALSYEKLGHEKGDRAMFAKANDLFSKIEARDSEEGEDGRLVLGRWGRAARTSRQTMLWILDEGQWRPSLDPRNIRWEKEPNEKKEKQ